MLAMTIKIAARVWLMRNPPRYVHGQIALGQSGSACAAAHRPHRTRAESLSHRTPTHGMGTLCAAGALRVAEFQAGQVLVYLIAA